MKDATYWGILCRTCKELVAFDIAPSPSFVARAANYKPGAIRCSQGHNHIYFPRDFQYFLSETNIDGAVMEQNRTAYEAINPDSSTCAPFATTTKIDTKPLEVIPTTLDDGLDPCLAPDPRREAARLAAKNRWTEWASKKLL